MNTISITNPETNEVITYNESEVSRFIKESKDASKNYDELLVRYQQSLKELRDLRSGIYDLFNGGYTQGDEDITISVEEINEWLEANYCDSLKRSWSASVRIYVNFSGLQGSSEDEIRNALQDDINVELQSIDGDLWVDDIEVTEVQSE
jgi:hypothetical protein